LAIGANEYISKPIKLKQLILVIQKLLKRWSAQSVTPSHAIILKFYN
jgi:DNA-binding response OmpR family regulator